MAIDNEALPPELAFSSYPPPSFHPDASISFPSHHHILIVSFDL